MASIHKMIGRKTTSYKVRYRLGNKEISSTVSNHRAAVRIKKVVEFMAQKEREEKRKPSLSALLLKDRRTGKNDK